MKKLQICLSIFIIFLCSSLSFSQTAKNTDVTFAKGENSMQIPFENDFGLIFLQVNINNSEPLWFILDTGFDDNIINANLPKQLGIELKDKQTVPQPGGSIEMGKASGLNFKLKGVSLTNQKAMSAPLSSLQPIIGRSFHGILGHDFISQFVVEIDYERKILNLYKPDSFEYKGKGEIIHVDIIKREPFIYGDIVQPNRKPIPGKFKIDTGSLDAVGLNKNYFEDHKILPDGQKKLAEPGIGGGGETSGYSFRIEGFQIGSFLFNDLAIGVTTESGGFENRDDAGTFGAQILSRFKVFLDYQRDRIILEKRASVFDKPFEKDMSGMRIITASDDFKTFKIKHVLPNSPASEAGLQKDDVILKINNTPVSNMKLNRIWEMFQEKPNKKYKLEIQRGDSKMIKKIKLRKLI